MIDIENGGLLIKVQKLQFKGKDYIDVRKFYIERNTEKQEWKPTKKGIAIPIELIDQVLKAIKTTI